MNVLLQGDPMEPTSTDLIAQSDTLKVGEPVPDGWTVTTGNMHFREIWRIAYRYQIEEEMTDDR